MLVHVKIKMGNNPHMATQTNRMAVCAIGVGSSHLIKGFLAFSRKVTFEEEPENQDCH